MSAPAFTPGPWLVENGHDEDGADTETRYVVHEGTVSPDTAVCEVWYGAEANARLIAAAPSMYRQLEIFVSTIVNDDLLAMDPDLAREAQATVALLAKARGEQ